MNFNAPVAAVQTGAYASANVSFPSADSLRLIDAIEALSRAVETNTEMSSRDRAYSLEIASDLITATKAEAPNPAKVRGLLSGLAQTVQPVGSLQGAWDAVRSAAIAISVWFS